MRLQACWNLSKAAVSPAGRPTPGGVSKAAKVCRGVPASRRCWPLFLLMLALQTIYAEEPTTADQDTAITHLPQAVLHDQKGLWTSPARVRGAGLEVAAPVRRLRRLAVDDGREEHARAHPNGCRWPATAA